MEIKRVKVETMPDAELSAMSVFAHQLRAWRTKARLSQESLGHRLMYSGSLISEIERSQKSPSAKLAAKLDEFFDTPGTFADLQELVMREAWPSYFAPVVDFETTAIHIHEWEPRVIPGLLQTPDYARALISCRPLITPKELADSVSARLARQSILNHHPMYWTVIHEGVLRHIIGNPAIMCEQLDALIQTSESPHIIVQVLPFSAQDHPGADGPIKVFDLRDGTSRGYAECYGSGLVVETTSEVTHLATTINMIRAAALSPRESYNLLRQIRRSFSE